MDDHDSSFSNQALFDSNSSRAKMRKSKSVKDSGGRATQSAVAVADLDADLGETNM